MKEESVTANLDEIRKSLVKNLLGFIEIWRKTMDDFCETARGAAKTFSIFYESLPKEIRAKIEAELNPEGEGQNDRKKTPEGE